MPVFTNEEYADKRLVYSKIQWHYSRAEKLPNLYNIYRLSSKMEMGWVVPRRSEVRWDTWVPKDYEKDILLEI